MTTNLKETILVVDDEPGIRFFLEEIFTRDGYQVVAVDSGEAALERIAAQEFDLALIDLQMKGIGGIDVLTALHDQSPDTTAIVLTAHGSMETAVEALRQGAHDYLFKPCKADDLRESVRAGLLKRQRELEGRAQSTFASTVSHELRNPLASIGLNLYLLERSKPEERDSYLDALKQEADRMKDLVESTLTLSQLETNRSELALVPVDLNAVVEQVVAEHQPRAQAAGLELVFEPDADLAPVRAERSQLIQVVTNLVTNAINYTPSGRVQVGTYLDAKREQACLRVQDTGMGIEAEDIPRLFERFYRGRRVTESDIPGTGLGLAIIKEIVNLHGGEIQVESRVGEGTTFSVWLPLER
ncbi:MAG: response regulator [Anaerolineae bacterium]